MRWVGGRRTRRNLWIDVGNVLIVLPDPACSQLVQLHSRQGRWAVARSVGVDRAHARRRAAVPPEILDLAAAVAHALRDATLSTAEHSYAIATNKSLAASAAAAPATRARAHFVKSARRLVKVDHVADRRATISARADVATRTHT